MNHEDDEPEMPLPLIQADGTEALEATVPGGPSPDTPIGAAMLWWMGLQDRDHYRVVLDGLSANPTVWGDYSEPAEKLAHLGIAQHPIESPDRPRDLAYVKFLEIAGESVQAVGDIELQNVWILTMVRSGSRWLVWGMSLDYCPPASEVFLA
jgi:hypothetical protein